MLQIHGMLHPAKRKLRYIRKCVCVFMGRERKAVEVQRESGKEIDKERERL